MYADDARFCTRDGTRLLGATRRDAPPALNSAVQRRRDRPPRPARSDAAAPISHHNLVGKTLQGRYQIVKKVGEGGMSFVYLANDIATRERYAIKVLSAALSQDENAMARLRREASVGMRLAHPNICHIIRLGETEDGLVYVVMPFVEGEVLSDRTNRHGVIPLGETARLVRDIAAGLAGRARAQDRASRSQARERHGRARRRRTASTPSSWTSVSPRSGRPAPSCRS